MDEIDFKSDRFDDIVAKDKRYDARAYALLADVLGRLMTDGRHASGSEILEEFHDRTLDQYGPLAYTVLSEWGLKSCKDIGEMMFNLVEGHRIGRDDEDSPEAFVDGYDFKEAFLGPFLP